MLTSELKMYLIDKINNYLAEHQKRRKAVTKKDIEQFMFKI